MNENTKEAHKKLVKEMRTNLRRKKITVPKGKEPGAGTRMLNPPPQDGCSCK